MLSFRFCWHVSGGAMRSSEFRRDSLAKRYLNATISTHGRGGFGSVGMFTVAYVRFFKQILDRLLKD